MSNYANHRATQQAKSYSSLTVRKFLRVADKRPGELPEEYTAGITQGQLLDITASIFNLPSCGQETPDNAYIGPDPGEQPEDAMSDFLQQKYPGRAGAEILAAEFGLADLCLPENLDGGEISRPVYVHASDQDTYENYNLVSHDADKGGPVEVNADIYLRIEFSNVSYAPIYYYIDIERLNTYLGSPLVYGSIFEFRGRVLDINGNQVKDFVPSISHGEVHLPGNSSGILIIRRLPIKYHIWTITIPGQVMPDGERRYTALVSASASGIAPVHQEIEETITTDEADDRCSWLDLDFPADPGDGSVTTECNNCEDPEEDEPEEEEEEEPEGTCEGEITPEEYAEICNGGPLQGCLPGCRVITEVFNGPVAIEGGAQKWIDEYDGLTTFVALMPEDGGPCGTTTHEFIEPDASKCPGIPRLVWDEDNPDLIAPGGSVVMEVTGGDPDIKPIEWSINGGIGYSFSPSESLLKYVAGRVVTVYADTDVCGPTTIKADDNCTTAQGPLQHTGGIYTTPVELNLNPGQSGTVYAVGGVGPPLDWQLDGNITLISGGGSSQSSATIQLNSDACDIGGTVSVSDACSTAECPVNSNYRPIDIYTGVTVLCPVGSSGNVYLRYGATPYTWWVTGDLVITAGGGPTNSFVTVKNNGNGGTVHVSDSCTSDTWDIAGCS